MPKLFAFGLGYSASAIGAALLKQGWQVVGTARSAARLAELEARGFQAVTFEDTAGVRAHLSNSTHSLSSVPPDEQGDAVLRNYGQDLKASLTWMGYLSTIGVYGDYGGAWIDETAALQASSARGQMRVEAETAWAGLARQIGIPLDIFRLAGIYGPGRSPLEKIKQGKTQRIVKPGQVFNRIHVDDIAQTVLAAMVTPDAQDLVRAFNVSDDEPAPPQEVTAYAAELIGVPAPPEVPFEKAELSPMARSFYNDNKRVHNDKIKRELGVRLVYPSYREGLKALASGGV